MLTLGLLYATTGERPTIGGRGWLGRCEQTRGGFQETGEQRFPRFMIGSRDAVLHKYVHLVRDMAPSYIRKPWFLLRLS